jgi:Sep-tRNA:Cys-tRNA synthetase
VDFGDGYSICDQCLKGALDKIQNPPIGDFFQDFAEWVNQDRSFATGGARHSKRIALKVIKKIHPERNIVLVDANAHYSTFLAVEENQLVPMEVPHDGKPTYRVNLEAYGEKIDEVVDKTGVLPVAALLTHVDYQYGNLNDPAVVGNICKQKDVPFILNGAYSIGILPPPPRSCEIDFITASGHKSMAASGPVGMLAFKEEYAEGVFERSKVVGDITGRSWPGKYCNFLGCPSVYGAPLATLMASFPAVVERCLPKNAEEEVKKVNFLVGEILKIEDFAVQGVLPKEHPLMKVMTPGFAKVSETHPRKGFFVREEFKKRGIIGMAPGISKSMKINTFGLTWEQVRLVAWAFKDIAAQNGLNVTE